MLSNATTWIEIICRCDDSSDDNVVSPRPRVNKGAVFEGIGHRRAINLVMGQVDLRPSETAQTFVFSRLWTSPRTVLHLASGLVALLNNPFLIAGDDFSCKDMLVEDTVSQHLCMDSRTLLGNNSSALDGTDCRSIGNPAEIAIDKIKRLMIARPTCARKGFLYKWRSLCTKIIAATPKSHALSSLRSLSGTGSVFSTSLLDQLNVAQHNKI